MVYFAGHGVSEGQDEYASGYLMPVDASSEEPDVEGIEMEWLQKKLNGFTAKHVLFLADACYSGIAIRSRSVPVSPDTPDYLSEITRESVRVTMTAGTAEQEALEHNGHGLFTLAFLQALEGRADQKRTNGEQDGWVTTAEIEAYIQEMVPSIA